MIERRGDSSQGAPCLAGLEGMTLHGVHEVWLLLQKLFVGAHGASGLSLLNAGRVFPDLKGRPETFVELAHEGPSLRILVSTCSEISVSSRMGVAPRVRLTWWATTHAFNSKGFQRG